MKNLIDQIKGCSVCEDQLMNGVRPVIQAGRLSNVVIIGQAPGRKVHETGIPWNDASGKMLRNWLDVDDDVFYDPQVFAIMAMGFCYPGKGKSGDLPPMPQCAGLWHPQIFKEIQTDPLVLLIGQYAQRYYLKENFVGVTETVRRYKEFAPRYFPLPHPSPRNFNWFKSNPWFLQDVIPALRQTIQSSLASH
jgi:uracil-DNA glycosylase family 4